MNGKQFLARCIIGATILLVVTSYVVLNLIWADAGFPDHHFWPGGLTIMADGVIGIGIVFGILMGIGWLIHWVADNA